ncbi:MAG: Asp-tRNA(Asn)/Glu-tRNA(Gln) amidotransferase subunit GatC [Deltaproteobacteria bacterium]|nr:Asp-tRNA(Asn)/Glu-tRNA(Gln) amidotransferase subunit GatC [Deltaproteobacteria bacterium]MBW2420245.1 Asp-tRNA(Asn)/Glu-tRNA(Gln) amidotransferase subunit GatC [Deltaproteobacteria bacterium]
MARITPDEVQYIAGLARISLSEDEVRQMARDMDQILDYVATLEELDTQGIEPTAHAIPLDTPVREDEAVPGIDPELAVGGAPQRAGTAFVVPKVIDDEGDGS